MTVDRHIAVIGLGYVGLPIAIAFGKKNMKVTGFDIDASRVTELKDGYDRTGEVSAKDLESADLTFASAPEELKQCDFFIVTVPTPIDQARRPDLGALLAASRTVGSALSKGDIVVYESTVYPGCTEDDCVPVLEAVSGLKWKQDFSVGYSPERINPGDKEHRFETITKVVSGDSAETLTVLEQVYGAVVDAGLHAAASIKTAEASKVIENAQRDINIAFVNELSVIFHRLGIDTHDVLAAARTKWNFLPFSPGLVGGHCIGVDPYYLTHRAEMTGYHPDVLLAGRRINDGMGQFIATETLKLIGRAGTGKVAILGATFKENVPDIRNSRVVDIVTELQAFSCEVYLSDPLADADEVAHEFPIGLTAIEDIPPVDAVVLAVPHAAYLKGGWELVTSLSANKDSGVVIDVKAELDRNAMPNDWRLWRP